MLSKLLFYSPSFIGYVRREGQDESVFDNLLKRGPVGVAVDANEYWFSYKSGLFDSPCGSGINHAVTLVGYNETKPDDCNNGGAYWIIRNFWSPGWGESGNMRVKVNKSNTFSCNIEKYAYQTNGFTTN